MESAIRRCWDLVARPRDLDNLSTHRTPDVQNWLPTHRQVPLSIPDPRIVDEPCRKLLLGAHRQETHPVRPALGERFAAHITGWVNHWNDKLTRFVRHRTADQILERPAGRSTANSAATE